MTTYENAYHVDSQLQYQSCKPNTLVVNEAERTVTYNGKTKPIWSIWRRGGGKGEIVINVGLGRGSTYMVDAKDAPAEFKEVKAPGWRGNR